MARLGWSIAIALVPAGIATYLVWESDLAWFLGLLMVAPFAYLSVRRATKRGYTQKSAPGGDGTAWGPP